MVSRSLCVQEPLRLSADGEFPSALLTDAPRPITLSLTSSHGPVKSAFFLQSANAHLELAGRDSEIVPLSQQADPSQFAGELQARSAGAFRARAYLDSPYGEVETYLGDLTAVDDAGCDSAAGVGRGVRSVASRLVSEEAHDSIAAAGGCGESSVHPTSAGGCAQRSYAGQFAGFAGQTSKFKMMLEGDPGQVHVIDYTATWNDGKAEVTRHGTLRSCSPSR